MTRRGPLDLLLRVRELHERMARTRLAEASTAQTEAERAADALEEALAAMAVPASLSTPQFRAVMASQRSMATLVVGGRDRAAALAVETAAARDAWLLADRDRESLDRLVEREREAALEEAARAEQRATDDLATSRFSPALPATPTDGQP